MQTPPNVRMFATSSMKLAWLLAGIVYPEDADDRPEEYVSDYHDAMRGNLPEDQQPARNERFIAAKFIQKLLAKVDVDFERREEIVDTYYCINMVPDRSDLKYTLKIVSLIPLVVVAKTHLK